MDDAIYEFVESLDFDILRRWASFLDIDAELPPIDDMYPDWEAELRTAVIERMGNILEERK